MVPEPVEEIQLLNKRIEVDLLRVSVDPKIIPKSFICGLVYAKSYENRVRRSAGGN